MKSREIQYINLNLIRSKWHDNVLTDWQPDPEYIRFLKKKIQNADYIPPIVVVQEGDCYYVVNGHHRLVAALEAGENRIKSIVIEGSFEDSEPLRKAELLLKEFDRKTANRYQFSGYLDRWAAAEEGHHFVNNYRPALGFRLYMFLKGLKNRLFKK